uniref:Centrosomal protein 63 n=1 Tax=Anolis carolinensis TaxID=28377 RepID=G1KJ28_ANOCA|nr:PREDICTED: centrosomal protein of 63 kDa isoform X1 [Anolis carolinensis]XP_008104576.1 PREDICTED: centrosomal protein of 63 kDa isoform X1 [Anolis carolinensis]XP_008104577.1 PREDICTED: centrosomal protein of 63 kDa isoform X1 [Anolis carolinensis]|eukprot:XP_003218410.1 PREDICTED: centrosomal protein of 63 kDa isoform X1 [Anolis carolinensis]
MEALLEIMQKQGQGRGLLTSCEAELQELMKQIDIMVAHKKAEWESQTQALESFLDIREQELSAVRNTLEEKHKEIERLCQRLEGIEQLNHDITVEYEQELSKVQEELARLKRSYEKLLKKQLKEARQTSKSQENDQSDVSMLTKKLEEFRQKSLDWETQRLHYQQHVASLEAQRKALAEQSELFQTQLSSRKEMLESVELASKSEIHHLTSKLEIANDTICANELEMKRLNMRVDDLTDKNKKILEEQQRLTEELKISQHSLEVLHNEKMELRATVLSQEDFINSLEVHNEELQQEILRLSEKLRSKEALLRMGSAKAKSIQSDEQVMEKNWELQLAEERLYQADVEMKKLKEQLLHKERSHNFELEGVKQEVTQLARELQQRDIRIASSSGSALSLEQQLKTEIEKTERKAVEHRAIHSQLETLRQENQHLSEMLQKVKNTPVAELHESYTKALNKVESEKQQLQKELAETRALLETSSHISQDQYESIVKEMQHQVTELKNKDSRKIQELQCKHEEEVRLLQARFEKVVQHYAEELQKMQQLSAKVSLSNPAIEQSPPVSRNHSVESLSYSPLLRSDALSHENKEFICAPASYCDEEFLPLSPHQIANLGAVVAKFFKEEEKRTYHIVECIDAHIEELKRESERTVQQFVHQK